MEFKFDLEYFKSCFADIVSVPSPVGYYLKMNPVLERYASTFGYTVTYDNKSTAYITVDGEDNSKTVLVGAHVDTIGMVVRTIDRNGFLRVRFQNNGTVHVFIKQFHAQNSFPLFLPLGLIEYKVLHMHAAPR